LSTFALSLKAFTIGAAAAFLAGCAGSPPAPGVPNAVPARTATFPLPASHLLLVGEQSTIAVYKAPFSGRPKILHVDSPRGMTIAPNGALIVADADRGIWVFDPPWRHKRLLFNVLYPSGQFLFDSKQRLMVPYASGTVDVFDPPYKKRPVLSFGVPAEPEEVAIDSHDAVFVGVHGTSGGAPTFVCKPPSYYPCVRLSIGNGAAATDSSDDLLTGISADRLGQFARPYKRATVKAKVPFPFYWLTTENSGATFVAGVGDGGNNYLGAFPSTIGGPFVQFSVEQYVIPGLQYAVGKNRDLFVSDGTFQQPYVSVYAYPYSSKARKRIRVKYPIMSVFAQ
jgi:hypothetical protein